MSYELDPVDLELELLLCGEAVEGGGHLVDWLHRHRPATADGDTASLYLHSAKREQAFAQRELVPCPVRAPTQTSRSHGDIVA